MAKEGFKAAIHWHFILLALQCAVVGSARFSQLGGCRFDRLMEGSGPLPVAVVADNPKKHGNGTWLIQTAAETVAERKPLRISIKEKEFDVESFKCKNSGAAENIQNVFGENLTCLVWSKLKTTEVIKAMIGKVLPKAIKMHTERLLVQQIGTDTQVTLATDGVCKSFATGTVKVIAETDMMLYYTASLMAHPETLSAAVPCALHTDGRPLIGAIAFNPEKVSDDPTNARYAAHEIAHALGFSYGSFKKKEGMIDETGKSDNAAQKRVVKVKSAEVLNYAKKQYNCQNMTGMQLESRGLPASDATANSRADYSSHWERRHAKDDLMATPSNTLFEPFWGFYTEITLAAFQDLGYYTANFGMAEPMTWGRNKGCEFLDHNCKEDPGSKVSKLFCDATSSQKKCTSNRRGIGMCQSGNSKVKAKSEVALSSLQSAFRAIALRNAYVLEKSTGNGAGTTGITTGGTGTNTVSNTAGANPVTPGTGTVSNTAGANTGSNTVSNTAPGAGAGVPQPNAGSNAGAQPNIAGSNTAGANTGSNTGTAAGNAGAGTPPDTPGDVFCMDYCPAVVADMSCKENTILLTTDDINVFGPASWCAEGSELKKKDETAVEALCVDVKCGENKTVYIRYGIEKHYSICTGGASITVALNVFEGGSIVCPPYDEVCAGVAPEKYVNTKEDKPENREPKGRPENSKAESDSSGVSAGTVLCHAVIAITFLSLQL